MSDPQSPPPSDDIEQLSVPSSGDVGERRRRVAWWRVVEIAAGVATAVFAAFLGARFAADYQREQIMWSKYAEFVDAAYVYAASTEIPVEIRRQLTGPREALLVRVPTQYPSWLAASGIWDRGDWIGSIQRERENFVAASLILQSFESKGQSGHVLEATNAILELCNAVYSRRDCMASPVSDRSDYCLSVRGEPIPSLFDLVREISVCTERLHSQLQGDVNQSAEVNRSARSWDPPSLKSN